MDKTYTWHPGTGRINSKWSVSTPLEADELLSSWLVRTAIALGCDPLVLTNDIWPKSRIWTVDLDRKLTPDQISKLVKITGAKVEQIEQAFIERIALKISKDGLEGLATWPWINALGARNRKRNVALQFCPACLAAEKKPFYKINWRLSWHTTCVRHHLRLIDTCPNCDSPIQPGSLVATDEKIAICHSCKSDISKSKAERSNQNSESIQLFLDKVLMHGCGTYGEVELLPAEIFRVVRYFVTLIRKAEKNRSENLKAFLKAFGIANPAGTQTGLPFEMIRTIERELLLAQAWLIYKAGPVTLRTIAAQHSINLVNLAERKVGVPSVIGELYPMHKKRGGNAARRISMVPKNKATVLRMYARLKRKSRMAA